MLFHAETHDTTASSDFGCLLRLLGPTQHSSLALSCLLPALGLVKLLFVDAVVLADSTFLLLTNSTSLQITFCQPLCLLSLFTSYMNVSCERH